MNIRLIVRKIRRALALMADKGPVVVVKAAVRQWALSASSLNIKLLEELDFILLPDRPARLTHSVESTLRINWFVMGVRSGSGGLFNVFRTIMYLERFGHECRVYLVGSPHEDEAKLNDAIQKNYFPIKARLELLRGDMEPCDALVATCWRSAYYARNQDNTAKKFYFVQDLEDQFFANGSLAQFARNTYQFGFVGLTAGDWIANTLRSNYGMQCYASGFSYDKELYSDAAIGRLPPSPKKLLFYARPETERRGFELGMLTLQLVARKYPDVEFVFVGSREKDWVTPFKVTYTGILTLDQLAKLYHECTLALVISLTNLSLLPLEIMACGCALVSNDGPNVRWLLNDEVAELAPSSPEDLAGAACSLLGDSAKREWKARRGVEFARSTDWQSEIEKVQRAILDAMQT
jgi:glycosyltransferase involved in cell wall biosynthesis